MVNYSCEGSSASGLSAFREGLGHLFYSLSRQAALQATLLLLRVAPWWTVEPPSIRQGERSSLLKERQSSQQFLLPVCSFPRWHGKRIYPLTPLFAWVVPCSLPLRTGKTEGSICSPLSSAHPRLVSPVLFARFVH